MTIRICGFAMLLLVAIASASDQGAAPSATAIQGWLSDEQCATGRASAGVYTGTSPRCAKECVAKGRQIVLIDPAAKQVLKIENQAAARDHIGDQVEVRGALNPQTKRLHIDAIKLVSKGVAACERTSAGQ